MRAGWRARARVGDAGAMVAVSSATPFLDAQYWQRWFAMPDVLFTAQVPAGAPRSCSSRSPQPPRAPPLRAVPADAGVFLVGMVGLGISI